MSITHSLLFLLVALLAVIFATEPPILMHIYNLNVGPSFLRLLPNPDGNYSMVFGFFTGDPLEKDGMYFIPNVNDVSVAPRLLSRGSAVFHWPNEIEYVPSSLTTTFGENGAVIVSTGFFVPGKSAGGIYYYPLDSNGGKFNISRDIVPIVDPNKALEGVNWFYHRAEYVKDLLPGKKPAMVSCKAHKPMMFGEVMQRLVILTQGSSGAWNETIASTKGCDAFFRVVDLDNDGLYEIVTADFFGSAIRLFWSENGNWLDTSSVRSVVIDDKIGPVYDIQFEDLNGDGFSELLVTNHETDEKGAIFIYSIPKDIRNDVWKRKILYRGFPVLKSGIGQASPGEAIAFKRHVNDKNKYIVVSGDGAEFVYLFAPVPTSDDPLNYELVWSQNLEGTVGDIDVADVNGDGYAEIFVNEYDNEKIYAYTFNPNV